MDRLTGHDLSALTHELSDLYSLRDRSALIEHLLALVGRLIPADLFSYIEADPVEGRFAAVRRPEPDRDHMLEIFAPMAPDHPVIRHTAATGSRHAHRVGEFLTRSQWHAQPMYSEFMRPERIEHQLGVSLPVHEAVMTFLAAHRSGGADFTGRDQAMLSALAPHATRALLNADILAVLDHSGGVVEATPTGRIRWTTPLARHTLAEFFGPDAGRSDRLPDALAPTSRHLPALGPVVRERGTRRLVIRRFWRDEVLVVVLAEDDVDLPRLRLSDLGLSIREVDVVLWLAAGKTNAQIAEILSITEPTVKKHLVQAFNKLGVDSRVAAALRVRDLATRAAR
jgi:DNA-binding CsgD family transcriptional regulator